LRLVGYQGIQPLHAPDHRCAGSGGVCIAGVVVKRLAALAITLTLVLPAGPVRGAAAPADTPLDQIDWGQAPEYRIVPGDELGLNFGPREDLNRELVRLAVVRTDGRVTVFPIGDVVAAGRTPVELQAELIRLLAGEYRQPRVTVEVVKSAANRVHVLGRVKKPGSRCSVAAAQRRLRASRSFRSSFIREV